MKMRSAKSHGRHGRSTAWPRDSDGILTSDVDEPAGGSTPFGAGLGLGDAFGSEGGDPLASANKSRAFWKAAGQSVVEENRSMRRGSVAPRRGSVAPRRMSVAAAAGAARRGSVMQPGEDREPGFGGGEGDSALDVAQKARRSWQAAGDSARKNSVAPRRGSVAPRRMSVAAAAQAERAARRQSVAEANEKEEAKEGAAAGEESPKPKRASGAISFMEAGAAAAQTAAASAEPEGPRGANI